MGFNIMKQNRRFKIIGSFLVQGLPLLKDIAYLRLAHEVQTPHLYIPLV